MLCNQLAIKFSVCIRHIVFKSNCSKSTMSSQADLNNLNLLFLSGVNAVQPKHLLCAKNVSFDAVKETIECDFNGNRISIDISGNKRCHLVGFGKAVYGMASELCKVLGNRLESGIISVPLNTQKTFSDIHLPKSIRIFEGAANNLPDKDAEFAANQIVQFTKSLNEDDILFALISGGGSALLPLPCDGVKLAEKLDIIKKLTSKGATITDINRVRINLSRTKGGKLAHCARNASSVITFIISDIIGDPLNLIASGPTVLIASGPLDSTDEHSIDILKRYALWDSLPEHIKNVMSEHRGEKMQVMENVHNMIIASNEIAVNAVLNKIHAMKLKGIILSTAIEGNVADISKAYFELGKLIQSLKYNKIEKKQFLQQLTILRQIFHIRDSFLENIVRIVEESTTEQIDLCVIGGGETTVEITGNGMGGRNQELALRFSHLSFDDSLMDDVQLLSAGTDGIDGPTTAAGAIGGAEIIRNYLMIPGNSKTDIDSFIHNNDSFRFYSNLLHGKYHIVTGHTGTNVMDLHLLYFKHCK